MGCSLVRSTNRRLVLFSIFTLIVAQSAARAEVVHTILIRSTVQTANGHVLRPPIVDPVNPQYFSPLPNADGTTVFPVSQYRPNTGNFTSGYAVSNGGIPKGICLYGDAAPGGGTFTTPLYFYSINSHGEVAVEMNGPRGIFRSDGNTVSALALAGSPSPAGGNYRDFGAGKLPPQINDAGMVAFSASLNNGTVFFADGVFLHDGTSVRTIAVRGSASPSGGTFDSPGIPLAPDASGRVVFGDTVNGGASGIFRGDGTTTTAIALNGAPAPRGGNFSSLQLLYDYQHAYRPEPIVFTANLSGGSSSGGIFASDGAATRTIALQGDIGQDGQTFNTLQPWSVNTGGAVAFEAFASGSNSLYVDDGLTQRLIAHTGGTAPGTTAKFTSFVQAGINNRGIVAFSARLDSGAASDTGIWYTGPDGQLQLLAREGNTITAADGFTFTTPGIYAYQDNLFPGSIGVGENGVAWMGEGGSPVVYTSFDLPEPAMGLAWFGLIVTCVSNRRRRSTPETK